ncbi:MAG: hypothetical protein ACRCWG_10085 [Sarcina sp.]
MNLDELKGNEDTNSDEEGSTASESEFSKVEKEDLCRKLTNEILDLNPDIVDKFNNGNIAAIGDAVEKLRLKVDFDTTDEALNNIVGEEILTR